jgi:hypothetical protein
MASTSRGFFPSNIERHFATTLCCEVMLEA